jgi:hypothetical protein
MKEQKFLLEIGAEHYHLIDDTLEDILKCPKYSTMIVKPMLLKHTSEKIQTYIPAFPEITVNSVEDFLMSLIAQHNWHITFDYQQLMFCAWNKIDTAEAFVKIEMFKYK